MTVPPLQTWYSALLTPLSLAINVVLGLAGIWGLWKKRTGNLVAEVTHHDFAVPFSSLADVIAKDAWEKVNPYSFDRANSLWLVRISNLSKKKAVGVSVNMPSEVSVAQIEKNMTKRLIFPSSGQISLDDLSPKDTVVVRVWCSSWHLDVEKVVVSYDEGVARMKPQYLVGKWLRGFGLVIETDGFFLRIHLSGIHLRWASVRR